MSLDVYTADEQADHPVAVDRWTALARAVLEAEGIVSDTEVSLLFVDEPAIAALNERFLEKEGPTDVLAFPIEERGRSRRAARPTRVAPAPGRTTRTRIACSCSGTSSSARPWPPATPSSTVSSSTTRSPSWSSTGSSTSLGMDHEADEEAERMERREQELLARHYRPVS